MELTQITPFVPCTALRAQIGFYRDVLGFSVGYQAEGYAFLRRDKVALRLVQVSDDVNLQNPERQGSFYIDVKALDAPPAGRERAAFNQPYGQPEFHVIDEDCTLIFFGEALGR